MEILRLDDSFITSLHLTIGWNTFLNFVSITYINAISENISYHFETWSLCSWSMKTNLMLIGMEIDTYIHASHNGNLIKFRLDETSLSYYKTDNLHYWQKFKIVLMRKPERKLYVLLSCKTFVKTQFLGVFSRISFHFFNSIFQGSRFSFKFLYSIFQGSRISFQFLNFCQKCYYFQN